MDLKAKENEELIFFGHSSTLSQLDEQSFDLMIKLVKGIGSILILRQELVCFRDCKERLPCREIKIKEHIYVTHSFVVSPKMTASFDNFTEMSDTYKAKFRRGVSFC